MIPTSVLKAFALVLLLLPIPRMGHSQEGGQPISISSIAPPSNFDDYLAIALSQSDNFKLEEIWTDPLDADFLVIFLSSPDDLAHVPSTLLPHLEFLKRLGPTHMYFSTNISGRSLFSSVAFVDVMRFREKIGIQENSKYNTLLLSCASAFTVVQSISQEDKSPDDTRIVCDGIVRERFE